MAQAKWVEPRATSFVPCGRGCFLFSEDGEHAPCRPTFSAEAQTDLLDLCIQIQQIAAPTGDEAAARPLGGRPPADARLCRGRRSDELHNVYACVPRPAAPARPCWSPPTRTRSFRPRTDLAVRHDDAPAPRLWAGHRRQLHGRGRRCSGWRRRCATPSRSPVDVWLVANVGEEGQRRPARHACGRRSPAGQCWAPASSSRAWAVAHRAPGAGLATLCASRRRAPGGHSWSDFGTASADSRPGAAGRRTDAAAGRRPRRARPSTSA